MNSFYQHSALLNFYQPVYSFSRTAESFGYKILYVRIKHFVHVLLNHKLIGMLIKYGNISFEHLKHFNVYTIATCDEEGRAKLIAMAAIIILLLYGYKYSRNSYKFDSNSNLH